MSFRQVFPQVLYQAFLIEDFFLSLHGLSQWLQCQVEIFRQFLQSFLWQGLAGLVVLCQGHMPKTGPRIFLQQTVGNGQAFRIEVSSVKEFGASCGKLVQQCPGSGLQLAMESQQRDDSALFLQDVQQGGNTPEFSTI